MAEENVTTPTEETVVEQEQVVDGSAEPEAQPEMTQEEAFEFNKLSPAAQREFQKLQQNHATLARTNAALLKERRSEPQTTQGPSPIDKLRDQETAILEEFEKLGDDVPSAALQAKLYRVQNQIKSHERQAQEQREAQNEQLLATQRAEQRFETDWKRANPTVASQYNTILEQSRLEVERRNPGLDPASAAFSAKWEARMELMTEQAASAIKSKTPAKIIPKTPIPPSRDGSGARPAGNVANPGAKPGAPEKIDYSKVPTDYTKVPWTV